MAVYNQYGRLIVSVFVYDWIYANEDFDSNIKVALMSIKAAAFNMEEATTGTYNKRKDVKIDADLVDTRPMMTIHNKLVITWDT